ncbi:MAG: LLM class F420-dependent oxidoreductase [Microthrixaceae bacterium]
MKFAIAFANIGPCSEPGRAIEFARAAEAAGFESLWTVEHVVVPADYQSTYPYDPSGRMPGPENAPMPDPLVWLSFLASATSTLRLATGILVLPQRNPVVLAKELATLDHLSGGRLLLGVGSGWLEEEFEAIGIPFAERGRRTDDALGALRALWAEEPASYEGEFTSFSDCILSPRPAGGKIPVHIGGHSPVAARRAGRLGDGFFPASGTHEQLRDLFDIVRSTAEDQGRDPDGIELTTGGNGAIGERALAEVEALAELGVERVVLPSFLFWGHPTEDLARYGEEVIARC